MDNTPTQPLDPWSPIESAPQDGTDVLLWDRKDVYKGYWDYAGGGWWERTTGYNDGGDEIKPTHWKHLPEGPLP